MSDLASPSPDEAEDRPLLSPFADYSFPSRRNDEQVTEGPREDYIDEDELAPEQSPRVRLASSVPVQCPLSSPTYLAAYTRRQLLSNSLMTNLATSSVKTTRFLKKGAFCEVWQALIPREDISLATVRDLRLEDSLVQGKPRKVFAVKILRFKDNQEFNHGVFDLDILSDIYGGPFLIRLRGFFEDEKRQYFLMDYCPGGEINIYLQRAKYYGEPKARFWISELVVALDWLHQKEIVHHDINPHNVLLDEEGHVVLVGFGFSRRLLCDSREEFECTLTEYMAPELSDTAHEYTILSDWWCLGVLTYELLVGRTPLKGHQPLSKFPKVLGKTYLNIPGSLSPEARDLITNLCAPDTKKRLGKGGIHEIKAHPWFSTTDWDAVAERKVKPNIVPYLEKFSDTRNHAHRNRDYNPTVRPVFHGGFVRVPRLTEKKKKKKKNEKGSDESESSDEDSDESLDVEPGLKTETIDCAPKKRKNRKRGKKKRKDSGGDRGEEIGQGSDGGDDGDAIGNAGKGRDGDRVVEGDDEDDEDDDVLSTRRSSEFSPLKTNP